MPSAALPGWNLTNTTATPSDTETDVMILLSRLNGTELGLNPDLIERVETTPDTVITLIDGTKYVIAEASTEVVARIIEFRARIIASADDFAGHVRHEPTSLQLVADNTALYTKDVPASGADTGSEG